MKRIKKIYRKLFSDVHSKYRLVLRDGSFREVFSFRLSRFNVIVGGGIALFLVISATILLIAFTPLKQIIPGYMREDFVSMAHDDRIRIDSLINVVEAQSLMLGIMQNVMENKVPADEANVVKDSLKNYSDISYRISVQDSILRRQVEAVAHQFAVRESK
ncbi:MAG: hypothetical protein LBQ31_05070 [Bacteroidales bacterium]|jgi:hypothetical protein|nr:hypothetical protein [Bacteroidales bacterium]